MSCLQRLRHGRLHQQVGTGWLKYEYDEAGRIKVIKTDSGTALETNTYGTSRERLKKEASGTRTYYAWGGSSVLAEYAETGSQSNMPWTKHYVYAGSRLLSTAAKNGSSEKLEYHHPNRLGTKMVSDPVGATNQEQAALPFGTKITAETQAATNQRFTSYDRSDATGLDYAVNRTYNSGQGRFTTVDPIGMGDTTLTSPQSMNLYGYVRNNPIDFVDPSGQNLDSSMCSAEFSYSQCGGDNGFWGSILSSGGGGWGSFGNSVAIYNRRVSGTTGGTADFIDRILTIREDGYDPWFRRYTGDVTIQILDEDNPDPNNPIWQVILHKPTLNQVIAQMREIANGIARNQIREQLTAAGITANDVTLTNDGKGFTFDVRSTQGAEKINDFLKNTSNFSSSGSRFHFAFHYNQAECSNGGCRDYRSKRGVLKGGHLQVVYNPRAGRFGVGYIDVDLYAPHGSGIRGFVGHAFEVIGGFGSSLPIVPRVRYKGLPSARRP